MLWFNHNLIQCSQPQKANPSFLMSKPRFGGEGGCPVHVACLWLKQEASAVKAIHQAIHPAGEPCGTCMSGFRVTPQGRCRVLQPQALGLSSIRDFQDNTHHCRPSASNWLMSCWTSRGPSNNSFPSYSQPLGLLSSLPSTVCSDAVEIFFMSYKYFTFPYFSVISLQPSGQDSSLRRTSLTAFICACGGTVRADWSYQTFTSIRARGPFNVTHPVSPTHGTALAHLFFHSPQTLLQTSLPPDLLPISEPFQQMIWLPTL